MATHQNYYLNYMMPCLIRALTRSTINKTTKKKTNDNTSKNTFLTAKTQYLYLKAPSNNAPSNYKNAHFPREKQQ